MNAPDGGLVLALSFVLLGARSSASALALAAAQAAVLTAYAIVRGFDLEAAGLLLNAAGLPFLLYQVAPSRPRAPRIGFSARLCIGAVLALLAAPFSVSLAALLLGLLLSASSGDRVVQLAGLLAMQNGIAVAGLDLPEPERFAAILPVIPALACAALWAARERAG